MLPTTPHTATAAPGDLPRPPHGTHPRDSAPARPLSSRDRLHRFAAQRRWGLGLALLVSLAACATGCGRADADTGRPHLAWECVGTSDDGPPHQWVNRAPVPGGWIYCTAGSGSIAFVPSPTAEVTR